MKPSRALPDFDRIKRTTDLAAVVAGYGIALKREGKDLVGLCPFHEDRHPSLRVTPSKGLFRCMSCGAAGNAIQFVARKEGITDKEAALKLLSKVPGVRRAEPLPSEPSFPRPLPPGESAALLQRVVTFYTRTLSKDRAGLDYLKTRRLDDPSMLETFQVGYCNGTLKNALPQTGQVIEGLKALGVLNKRGEEHLRGRVVIPIFDAQGEIAGLYGRAIQPCEPGQRHRYLPGPHRGVFNGQCAKTTQTLLITEGIFDAMSLWQAGFKNAISLYGNQTWTADHQKLLEENGITEIYLCLDNDEAGQAGARRLEEKLLGIVRAVHVVKWPEGVKDACDFFSSRSASDFETVIKAANPTTEQKSETAERLGEEEIIMTPDGFQAKYGPRRYELRAIEKSSAARLKATIKAVGLDQGRFHIDTVDFYLSRSRRAFLIEAARLFRETPEIIESDLNRLTLQLEDYVGKRLEDKTPFIALVSESEKLEALKLGRNPDLAGEILRDIGKLGVVGEKTNALMSYIVMATRKMDDPLALLTLSGSGAGKSYLQDTILSLCPEEDLIKLTSLSDRALFYKGEDSLKHKVLAVEEEAGASGAHYAIRNLISSKKLVIETTIKNPLTGKMETQVNTVRGPTAVFQTTTNPEADAETRSRFIITSVDESAEQTRAILQAQRNSHTVEGLLRKKQRAAIIVRHHAFQRMLKPLAVVNPFEPLLSYGDDRLLFRRDHPKYLSLILAIAFLHQMQRPVKNHPEIGNYIEATLDDIAIANDLALELFGSSLDDLSSPSRELLRLTHHYAVKKAAAFKVSLDKIEVSRRELREAIKWSEYQLRTHIRQLVELGYLAPVSGRFGQLYCYRLLYGGESKNFVAGVKSVEELRRQAENIGILPKTSRVKTQPRSLKTNLVGTSRAQTHEVLNGHFPSENGHRNGNFEGFSGGHIPVLHKNGLSRHSSAGATAEACGCTENGGPR